MKEDPLHSTDPNHLDDRLVVVGSKGWIALLLTTLLIVGALIWAFLGEIPNYETLPAIFLNEKGFLIARSPAHGTLHLALADGASVTKGQILGYVEGTETKEILSPNNGTILESFAREGELIETADPIYLIDPDTGEFNFYAFAPIESAQLITTGLPAYIDVHGINSRLYGKLRGTVTAISPFVVSKEHLKTRLGEKEIESYFTADKAVFEITITPEKNNSTPSGYSWTSETGPPGKIAPRSVGQAQIILETRTPISYVFSIWDFQKIKGKDAKTH